MQKICHLQTKQHAVTNTAARPGQRREGGPRHHQQGGHKVRGRGHGVRKQVHHQVVVK